MQKIDLSPLKDVIIPTEPSIFPLPWGWWAVFGGAIALIFTISFIVYRVKYSKKRYAFKLLKQIENSDSSISEKLAQISKLLKRVCLARFPREEIAPLTQQKWADFLTSHGDNAIDKQLADFIASSVYMPKNKKLEINEKIMYNSIQNWIQSILKEKHNGH